MRKPILYRILYAFADFVVSFGLALFSFGNIFQITQITNTQIAGQLVYSGIFAILLIVINCFFKIYRTLSENYTLYDALRLSIISLCLSLLGLLFIIVLPNDILYFDWYVLVYWAISTITLCLLIPSMRMVTRVIMLMFSFKSSKCGPRTLLLGAGSAAKIYIDDSRKWKNNQHNIVAILDDDCSKIGSRLSNIPIVGVISDVKKYVEKYKIEEVIIAIVALENKQLKEILSYLTNLNVRIRRMPLISEGLGPNDVRILDVDINELLCRDPVVLDNKEIFEQLSKKTVMVTGAGGSIGSELVRQIFMAHPKTLVLFDIYENSTYDIQMELVQRMRREQINDIELVTLIGSTYNESRIEQVIAKYRPDYIYHAAAYKHVPLMEDSPMEAIRTNVIGTFNVAKLADRYQVKKMVLVSTDKAVRPTNVMGATKRFAEMIVQYFAKKSKDTKYAAVRFGNVLGSNGSVVPLFKKQIAAGGPVTITDKNIIRYFMTIPEAVSLILQCGLFAKEGEIFVLDMGEPVKIIDLAEKLIHQSGLVPYKDIDIVVTGLRPGEKLYEELLIDKTVQRKTSNEKIYVEPPEPIIPVIEKVIDINKVFNTDNVEFIKKELSQIVDTYKETKL